MHTYVRAYVRACTRACVRACAYLYDSDDSEWHPSQRSVISLVISLKKYFTNSAGYNNSLTVDVLVCFSRGWAEHRLPTTGFHDVTSV